MAVHERNRMVQVYHSIVAIIMLIAGGVLLGVGIWLEVTDNAGPINLDYAGDNVFRVALQFGIGAIIVGGFLMVAAIAGIFALSRKCLGVTFRIIYVLMGLVILAVLVGICVLSTIVRSRGDAQDVKDFIADAWRRTVSDPFTEKEICKIEEHFKCRGFNDNDCVLCPLGNEDICSSLPNCANCKVQSNPSVGCYGEIISSVDNVFLPMAIVSGILAVIVFIDLFVTCAL